MGDAVLGCLFRFLGVIVSPFGGSVGESGLEVLDVDVLERVLDVEVHRLVGMAVQDLSKSL
jgi:hypothetical protein